MATRSSAISSMIPCSDSQRTTVSTYRPLLDSGVYIQSLTSPFSPFSAVDCQLLHTVFSAEAFLHELKRRGAIFQVAFFTCACSIYLISPHLLIVRICSQPVFRNSSQLFGLVDRIKNTGE
jgi:hypothetical protein